MKRFVDEYRKPRLLRILNPISAFATDDSHISISVSIGEQMAKQRTSEKPTGDHKKSHPSPKEVKMKLKKCRRSEPPLEGQLEAKKKRSVEPKSFVIAGSKNRARVGSYVRFRNGPAPGMETSVAKIIKLERTSIRGVYTVHVRWFYSPEDTRCGRQPHHGRMELLLSDHVTEESSASVVELCRVFTVDAYILRRLATADSRSYYWRSHYQTTTTDLETVMEYLYSSCPECRKSDYIEDAYILLHLTAKNENAAKA